MATRIKVSAKIKRQFKQLRDWQTAIQTQLDGAGRLENSIWDAIRDAIGDSDPCLKNLEMVYNHRTGVLEFSNEHQERLYAERLLAKTKKEE